MRIVDDNRSGSRRQATDDIERRKRFAEVRFDRHSVAEPHSLTSNVRRAVRVDEDDRRQIVGHQTLDPTENVFHHLVEVQGARHRRRAVAERLGIGALLSLFRLDSNSILDFASQALVGAHQLRRAPLHPLVELGEGALQVVLGLAAFGHVLEGAEHTDHRAGEVAQRHLVGLEPTNIARRAAQAFDDPEPRFSGFDDRSIPIEEPIGVEVWIVGPWHVAIREADHRLGLDARECGEHLVAPEVA